MPIKQIQLRGISRIPSDRMTQDGGCAESMNVHLDNQETAPTLPAEDISSGIYPEGDTRSQILFIHKMTSVTNYIAASSTKVFAYGETLTLGKQELFTLSSETVSKAVSLGNTLIVYTDKAPHYLLFKNGAYINLGTSVPTPHIEVITQKASPATVDVSVRVDDALDSIEDWNNAKSEGDENHAKLLGAIETMWDNVQLEISNQRASGVFCAPFFIVYALRMSDGTYINVSPPIMCGAGTAVWMTAKWETVSSHEYIKATLRNLFAIRARMQADSLQAFKNTFGQWVDAGLITSIDFFASTPIYTPAINSLFDSMDSNKAITFHGNTDKDIEDAVLSKSNFYLIKSFALNEDSTINSLIGGTLKIENSDDIGLGENLVVKERLPDSYRDSNQYIAAGEIMNFNNRELLAGVSEKLTGGYSFLNGQQLIGGGISSYHGYGIIIRFRIVDSASGATNYVISRYGGTSSETAIIHRAYIRNTWTQEFGYVYESELATDVTEYYSWLAYPDRRCDLAELYMTTGTYVYAVKEVVMKRHPLIECSYAFTGFGTPIWDMSTISIGQPICTIDELLASESVIKSSKNRLFLSDFENPFLFPAGNILTFPDNIVGMGMTSAPLSEGQVGDFDLYVFTEGGIRVLTTSSEGTFYGNRALPTNVSRHVALPGTITALEQAIVFITKRGVMLLSGGTVTELSRNMNGMPYSLESEVTSLISDTAWSFIVPDEEETLMSFMSSAKVAYDSNGARLIFFNPSKEYQYVYMLETETWHKIYSDLTSTIILNSYPDCLVSAENSSHVIGLHDFSTVLDDVDVLSDTANPVKGIIATRSFDLGEPDIRKEIRDIRIRGRFNREDVTYILMGSFDGIHWKRLRSLRGGSFKMFRLILLTNLTPTERISWIDVDYVSRFANKLR